MEHNESYENGPNGPVKVRHGTLIRQDNPVTMLIHMVTNVGACSEIELNP